MKLKLLLSAILFFAVSMNAFAMDIKNGKLLSHQEWQNGSIKMLPMEKSKQQKLLEKMLVSKKKLLLEGDDKMDVYAGSYLDQNEHTVRVGEELVVPVSYAFTIENHTPFAPGFYKISLTAEFLTLDAIPDITSQKLAEFSVYLSPMGQVTQFAEAKLTKVTTKTGSGFVTFDVAITPQYGTNVIPQIFHGISAASYEVVA